MYLFVNLPLQLILVVQVSGEVPLRVWILGDSLVRRAANYALTSSYGLDLGLSSNNIYVSWRGKGGLQLINAFRWARERFTDAQTLPDMLVLHAGTNDLGAVPTMSIKRTMESDFQELVHDFPRMTVVWSDILPRQCYINCLSSKGMDRSRKKLNRFARQICSRLDSAAIIAHNINHSAASLYQDGCPFI